MRAIRCRLVEMLDRHRMNRLQADGDLELRSEQVGKLQRQWADRVGVRFHRDGGERRRELRQAWQVLPWHGATVEKVARIVELQPVWEWQEDLLQRPRQLGRQSAGWSGTIERKPPQIAERARKRTLGAREEDRQGALDRSVRGALLLEQRTVRIPRIDDRLRGPEPPNARVSCGERGNGGDTAPRLR